MRSIKGQKYNRYIDDTHNAIIDLLKEFGFVYEFHDVEGFHKKVSAYHRSQDGLNEEDY